MSSFPLYLLFCLKGNADKYFLLPLVPWIVLQRQWWGWARGCGRGEQKKEENNSTRPFRLQPEFSVMTICGGYLSILDLLLPLLTLTSCPDNIYFPRLAAIWSLYLPSLSWFLVFPEALITEKVEMLFKLQLTSMSWAAWESTRARIFYSTFLRDGNPKLKWCFPFLCYRQGMLTHFIGSLLFPLIL